jgi:demethylmenaquinone methyltransferase/2-methoxy-6-polyprenyl-1,4-benzoquinol methylase
MMSTSIGQDKKPDRISGMFNAIAPSYDLVNHVLTVGIDRLWRKKAVASLELKDSDVLLDVCTGTGDIALEARKASNASLAIGVDFSSGMLKKGLDKVKSAGESKKIFLINGDATRLPLCNGSVDAVAVAFGIRNVENPDKACQEIARTLRSGGRLAILEFMKPRMFGLAVLYSWYFKYLLPLIGKALSGHKLAYSYLPASVSAFLTPDEFVQLLRKNGFRNLQAIPLTFGIVCLYTATR